MLSTFLILGTKVPNLKPNNVESFSHSNENVQHMFRAGISCVSHSTVNEAVTMQHPYTELQHCTEDICTFVR